MIMRTLIGEVNVDDPTIYKESISFNEAKSAPLKQAFQRK